MVYKRATRLSEELLKEISGILLRDISDPRLSFVTITRVDLSDDLRFAKVYYSVLGNEDRTKEALRALKKALPFIKKLLSKNFPLRHIPEIAIFEDKSAQYFGRIDKILKEIKEREE